MVKKPISQVELSFVIPACDEEGLIEAVLDTVDAVARNGRLRYEIVVVDDGSRDLTFEKATAYAKRNSHVKVLSYAANMGKGYALKTGFMQAAGVLVVFADGDCEVDLHTIWRYLAALEHGDIVIASKRHPDSHVEVPLARKILSYSFNVIVRLLTGVPFRDTQAGLKAMKKKAFVKIFPKLAVKRYAFDVELLAVAHLYGLKVVELPVNLKLDASFKLSEIRKMFVDVLGIAYRLRVIHWYQRRFPAQNRFQRFASFVFRGQ